MIMQFAHTLQCCLSKPCVTLKRNVYFQSCIGRSIKFRQPNSVLLAVVDLEQKVWERGGNSKSLKNKFDSVVAPVDIKYHMTVVSYLYVF